MKTAEFDYALPLERIAQGPLAERDASKLLWLQRATGRVQHRAFRELPSLLEPGDLLVMNDTKVVPARVYGVREKTGGAVEVMFLEALEAPLFLAFTKSGGKLTVGEYLRMAGGRLRVKIVERHGEAGDVVRVESREPLVDILKEVGHMPVPPYIARDSKAAPSELDRARYQTIYAREPGAVAAPTAGLHFTPAVFDALDRRGVQRTSVTLHVGPGTFKPVKTDDIEDHTMDAERFEIPAAAAEAVHACRERAGRVIAVGTTSVRTLESAACDGRTIAALSDRATLFITPGYEFKVIDGMLTNFHMPRGTPLMLVSALAGRQRVAAAYDEALQKEYRFLSYGDSMLVL
jgi:S-adenosylmethionine:tRNA ribosyltransferase-isomerase